VVDEERLREVLGDPALGRLVERLRRRLGRGQPLAGSLRLEGSSPAERQAIERLLGRRPAAGDGIQVRLDELEALLAGARLASSLREAVEVLVGEVRDERAARREAQAAWQGLHRQLQGVLPETLAGYVQELRAGGLLRRLGNGDLARAQALCAQLAALAAQLPDPGVSLAELAARVAGDAHALDPGSPLGSLGLRLAAHLAGAPAPKDAAGRRALWAQVGVLTDAVSASVLVLNLDAGAAGLCAQLLGACREQGEPCRLTLRQLSQHPPRFAPAAVGTVYVCENPSVLVRAADALGPRAAPLVCTEGQPATPVRLLLQALVAAGASLRYHGDFDWAGIGIANRLIAGLGAAPWRYRCADYQDAPGGLPLEGRPVAAVWDDALMPAMRARGVVVHEEAVMGLLVADLG
jgi:uncharacterized protein (TIGR02679 family)